MKLFDQKLGKDFLSQIPTLPGIYRFYDLEKNLIYIGKAKNLRRRLSQYRNTKRIKKHRKMRLVVQEAAELQFEVCSTELEAELLETRLIQTHQPKWNRMGAFFFLYPMIGIICKEQTAAFCLTARPEEHAEFQFFGAYRSRELTQDAFFALMRLLRYLGHADLKDKQCFESLEGPVGSSGRKKWKLRSYIYSYRQLPEALGELWKSFFQGKSRTALEELSLILLESAGARRDSQAVQENLRRLDLFWKREAVPLNRVSEYSFYPNLPVHQRHRDLLFLKYRRRDQTPFNIDDTYLSDRAEVDSRLPV